MKGILKKDKNQQKPLHQLPGPHPQIAMPDMQKTRDTRKIAIGKVGVKDISYPIVVMDKNRALQHTVARVNMYVDLPHHFKGTHMSRFIEILNAYREKIALDKMETILQRMKEKLGASCAHLEIQFPYFIEKKAPVSGARSLMEYTCTFNASLGPSFDFILGVKVPVTSLCPCSKELSRFGAHNQRSIMTVQGPLQRVHLDRGPDRDHRSVRQFARSTPCSSARTRSSSPSRPTRIPASWRTWYGRRPRNFPPWRTSPGFPSRRKISNRSINIPPMPQWKWTNARMRSPSHLEGTK